jgi:hypothetical protein
MLFLTHEKFGAVEKRPVPYLPHSIHFPAKLFHGTSSFPSLYARITHILQAIANPGPVNRLTILSGYFCAAHHVIFKLCPSIPLFLPLPGVFRRPFTCPKLAYRV